MQRRDTERAALQEVVTLLRLVDGGKVAVSDRTAQPSAATMLKIGALLRDGDFYEAGPEDSRRHQEIGPIRAFAWPLLLQAAKLVELNRKKLALTKAGRHALGADAADTLSLLWRHWTATTLLDEFNRVETIKGQHGKGKRSLTDAKARRATISKALKQCPIGRWVEFDEFSRFMRAAALDFYVSLDSWTLYISDPQYGHFGYDGYGGWDVVQGRYCSVSCLNTRRRSE